MLSTEDNNVKYIHIGLTVYSFMIIHCQRFRSVSCHNKAEKKWCQPSTSAFGNNSPLSFSLSNRQGTYIYDYILLTFFFFSSTNRWKAAHVRSAVHVSYVQTGPVRIPQVYPLHDCHPSIGEHTGFPSCFAGFLWRSYTTRV